MRPTRRNRVMVGSTLASADLTSLILGNVVAMPWLRLPAIEPEASNTNMASSVQGLRSFSSAASAHTLAAASHDKANAATSFMRKNQVMRRSPSGGACHMTLDENDGECV